MYYLLLLFTPLILYTCTLEVVESLKKNNDLRTFFFIHFIISFAYSLSSLNTKVFDSKQNLI